MIQILCPLLVKVDLLLKTYKKTTCQTNKMTKSKVKKNTLNKVLDQYMSVMNKGNKV